MKTIGEVLKLSIQFLEERKIDRSRRSAEEILSSSLGLKRMELYLQFDRPVIETELALLRERLKRLSKGEPLEYVIGEVEFLDCRIKIDSRALIPRPETEILVDKIVKKLKPQMRPGFHLWDLCTGSGCIGIALKKSLPDLCVTLSDLSKDALSLARENICLNSVQVEVLEGDFLNPFQGSKADFVVSNPPYVSTSEWASLDPSVRLYEPKTALCGGEEGFDFYERLQRELPQFLNPKAQVFLEIGAGMGEGIEKIFSHGPWGSKQLLSDWSGKSRFFFLEMQ